MTLHPHGCDPAPEPARGLEDAFRRARAASHSRRLDTAAQAALDALVAFDRAMLDRTLQLEAALEQAHVRIATLEAARLLAIRYDP